MKGINLLLSVISLTAGTVQAVSSAIGNAATDVALRDEPIVGSSAPQYLDGYTWTASSDTHGISMLGGVPGDVITDL